MANKQNIEVEVGTKPTQEPAPDQIGKAHPTPEPESEVGGRAIVRRNMQCYNCSGISWVWYDTVNYHVYTCPYCGANNVL